MRVLMVDQFAKTAGKNTVMLANELNEIEDMSVEVYLSDNTDIRMDEVQPLKISLGFHGAYDGNYFHKALCYLGALFELSRHIKKNGYDIIHLQWFSLPWIEWSFVLWLKLTKHKVVITVHDVVPFDRHPLETQFLNVIYNKSDVLLVHTKYAEKLFLEKYKIRKPIKVITQASGKKSNYCILDKKIAKRHFNITDDATVFLFYGTVRPSKGLDILVSAISEAYKKDNKVFLLAAGEPHRIDVAKYNELIEEKLSRNNSIINFGFVPKEEEKFYFNAADVLCLPYLELTQSGIAQLGLMYELPMIATDVGAMADVVRDGENGILVPPNDEERLSEAILKLEREKNMRECYSACSKKLGETEFSLTNKVDIIADIYREIVTK